MEGVSLEIPLGPFWWPWPRKWHRGRFWWPWPGKWRRGRFLWPWPRKWRRRNQKCEDLQSREYVQRFSTAIAEEKCPIQADTKMHSFMYGSFRRYNRGKWTPRSGNMFLAIIHGKSWPDGQICATSCKFVFAIVPTMNKASCARH